jgi:hypothetical protein
LNPRRRDPLTVGSGGLRLLLVIARVLITALLGTVGGWLSLLLVIARVAVGALLGFGGGSGSGGRLGLLLVARVVAGVLVRRLGLSFSGTVGLGGGFGLLLVGVGVGVRVGGLGLEEKVSATIARV